MKMVPFVSCGLTEPRDCSCKKTPQLCLSAAMGVAQRQKVAHCSQPCIQGTNQKQRWGGVHRFLSDVSFIADASLIRMD